MELDLQELQELPNKKLTCLLQTPSVSVFSCSRCVAGWQYSRITTIIIQKVGAPRSRSILNAADLVFADGCRNPSYKVRWGETEYTQSYYIHILYEPDYITSCTCRPRHIRPLVCLLYKKFCISRLFPIRQVIAKQHPKRDARNPLINNFTFRMFMFQDMQAGDTLMITANVIGCVDAQDCAPASIFQAFILLSPNIVSGHFLLCSCSQMLSVVIANDRIRQN